MVAKQKDFGVALVLWLLLGGFGAHRVYITEKVGTLLWYWLAVICTLTIILWVDLFKLKGMIEDDYDKQLVRQKLRN